MKRDQILELANDTFGVRAELLRALVQTVEMLDIVIGRSEGIYHLSQEATYNLIREALARVEAIKL